MNSPLFVVMRFRSRPNRFCMFQLTEETPVPTNRNMVAMRCSIVLGCVSHIAYLLLRKHCPSRSDFHGSLIPPPFDPCGNVFGNHYCGQMCVGPWNLWHY